MKKIEINLVECKNPHICEPYYQLEGDNRQEEILCRKETEKLFALPDSIKTPITLVISDEPLPESYKVKFIGRSDVRIHYEKKWREETLTYDADVLTRKLGLRNGDTYWVTLYWYK